jgi:hypothetical protein
MDAADILTPCDTNQSIALLLAGAIIGSVLFAAMLQDCKKKIPKTAWLKLGT